MIENQPAEFDTVDPRLSDIYRVGPDKPLGYQSLQRIEASGRSLSAVRADLKQKGLQTKVFTAEECDSQEGGELYVYDHKALRKLLEANKETLRDAKWPDTPRKFINYVATSVAEFKTPLFDLIADAFADKTNVMRTDVSDTTR